MKYVHEKCFSSILKGITMSNTPGSMSNEQKPVTPPNPQQQTQGNPQKPGEKANDKPSEQQK
jgi:hypothetical protein